MTDKLVECPDCDGPEDFPVKNLEETECHTCNDTGLVKMDD